MSKVSYHLVIFVSTYFPLKSCRSPHRGEGVALGGMAGACKWWEKPTVIAGCSTQLRSAGEETCYPVPCTLGWSKKAL
ncbi:hypothetical protein JTE90_013388 [Oedothorax gibbosus]|uniref:Secreted protein n=1 Tax=Oedothorax gibbosus TaxID=931172 RepID=A0AAV6TVQ4_9ARAC|nr:hypothetical protein JTE90_013388 [Oedothorax gibbosus]